MIVACVPHAKLDALSDAVPNIYAVLPTAQRLGFVGRLLCGGIGFGCLALLTLSAVLIPNPHGLGTHSASLGLPPCNFLQTTGLPCPSCGMTTSFSWFAHGDLLASAYVQPAGAALALLAAAGVWIGLYICISGRPVHRLLRLIPARYTLFPLLLIGVLAWGWKILIHLNGLDGWKS